LLKELAPIIKNVILNWNFTKTPPFYTPTCQFRQTPTPPTLWCPLRW